jgi:hypothetical protein
LGLLHLVRSGLESVHLRSQHGHTFLGIASTVGRLAFENLRSILIALDEDSELLSVLQLVATGLGIFELTHDVGVAISEEEIFASIFVLCEYFNVHTWKRFTSLSASHFQLTESLKGGYLKLVGVESLEFLLALAQDLNNHVLILQLLRYIDHLTDRRVHRSFVSSFSNHNLLNSVIRLDVAETFSIILQEGSSGEQDLSVDDVVLYRDLLDVDRFNSQCSGRFVKFNRSNVRVSPLANFLVYSTSISHFHFTVNFRGFTCGFNLSHFLSVVKLSIKFVDLIKDCQEKHAPRRDRVVVVFLHYSSGCGETVLASCEEVKVCL